LKEWDVVLRNISTLDGLRGDLAIRREKIAALGEVSGQGKVEFDAGGGLVFPGFVNAHTHLDKVGLLSHMTPQQFGKSLEENRSLLKSLKADYSPEEICRRAGKVVDEMLGYGTTAIRTQADVDPTARLRALNGVLALRDQLAGKVDLQIVAFPQEGVLSSEKKALLEEAIKMGADMLGGLPAVEGTPEDGKKHIDSLFEIAKKFDLDMEVQIDESNDPSQFLLPYLAEKTLAEEWVGRVCATHCISLSAVPDDAANQTIEKMARAQMRVIVTPSCNMITRSGLPARRYNSITRVKELLDAGIHVAMGTDNIRDIFYPLGNGSMLRELHVLATSVRLTGYGDAERLIKMGTEEGAKLMALDYGISAGKRADLIVAPSGWAQEVVSGSETLPLVIKGGSILVWNRPERRDQNWP
jgi:cytosine deaminase